MKRIVKVKMIFEGVLDRETSKGVLFESVGKVLLIEKDNIGFYKACKTDQPDTVIINLDEDRTWQFEPEMLLNLIVEGGN